MQIKSFVSRQNPHEALELAQKGIEDMKKQNFRVKQIAQSESMVFNTFSESKEFHFTFTILFEEQP